MASSFGRGSGAFIRGLYTNAQNPYQIHNIVKRSATEAVVASADQLQKRKREDDQPHGVSLLSNSQPGANFFPVTGEHALTDCDFSSFLGYDMGRKSSMTSINSNLKRCKLSVPNSMQMGADGRHGLGVRMGMRVGKRTVVERRKKNSRERMRRAGMSDKFKELYDLVCSGLVESSISAAPMATLEPQRLESNARGKKVAKPSKVLVLSEAIKAIETLGGELADLKRQNEELKKSKNVSEDFVVNSPASQQVLAHDHGAHF